MTLGQKIRARRLELGMSQEELGYAVGFNGKSAICKIEADERDLKQNKIKPMADALRVTPGYLMGWDDEETGKLPKNAISITRKSFPILGEIACGQPILAQETHDTYISASSNICADFCLIAKGDSMIEARIFDGDVVFIRATPIVENGCIAAVSIDDEATLKRWYFYPEEKKLVLSPANPKYAPLVYVGQELNQIRCLGQAVCFMSNL